MRSLKVITSICLLGMSQMALAATLAPDRGTAGARSSGYQKPTDLSIQKTADKPLVNRGEGITFSIKVKNEGRENEARDVVINDTLTPDFTKTAVHCPDGSVDNSSGSLVSCFIRSLPPQETVILTIEARAVTCTEKTWNTASVWNPYDDNPSNNSSTVNLATYCPPETPPEKDAPVKEDVEGTTSSTKGTTFSTEGTSSKGSASEEPPLPACYVIHPPLISDKMDVNTVHRRDCCESRFTVSPADTGETYNAVECCMEGYESPEALTCCTETSRAVSTSTSYVNPLAHCSR
ncbi:MAG: DUF11 domain-containing protein [Deltaproteobacteria bacterium]|nr:MAG: DUF11 domain-containing protein [Deltaproteobacteria bacterium]